MLVHVCIKSHRLHSYHNDFNIFFLKRLLFSLILSPRLENSRIDEATLARLKEECLVVEDIELHVKENAEKHHADLFECTDRDNDPQLVVRRGQEFKLTLTFQRPWSSKDDDMYLVFTLGAL